MQAEHRACPRWSASAPGCPSRKQPPTCQISQCFKKSWRSRFLVKASSFETRAAFHIYSKHHADFESATSTQRRKGCGSQLSSLPLTGVELAETQTNLILKGQPILTASWAHSPHRPEPLQFSIYACYIHCHSPYPHSWVRKCQIDLDIVLEHSKHTFPVI